MSEAFENRRNASGISVKLDLLHEDVSDMKAVLKELTAAISRLAVVESDQGHIRNAQERTAHLYSNDMALARDINAISPGHIKTV